MVTITPLGGASAGEATHIALQPLNNAEVLTACRNGSGILELISWHTTDNQVTRAADSTHNKVGEVEEVALTMSGRQAITAVVNGSGNLFLISWDVAPELKSITRLHDSDTQAGKATLVRVIAISC